MHRNDLSAKYCPRRKPVFGQGRCLVRLAFLMPLAPILLFQSAPAFAQSIDSSIALNGAPVAAALPGPAIATLSPAEALPDAPIPQASGKALPAANPCVVRNTGASMAYTASLRAISAHAAADLSKLKTPGIVNMVVCVPHAPPIVNWYARFLSGPEVKPLTPREKAELAVRNLIDPFNLITIAGASGIYVAMNSHSVYGPGLYGWTKDSATSLTEDMTGEFFGTFLIPSIAHQDPHYHRMPKASIPRRILHCIDQVAWTQGDNGKGMVNYADLVGFMFDDAVGDLYVPGQQTNFRASAERYATGLGTAPVDNFITEFLPDIASHIHVRVVLVQRIINQVARTDNNAQ